MTRPCSTASKLGFDGRLQVHRHAGWHAAGCQWKAVSRAMSFCPPAARFSARWWPVFNNFCCLGRGPGPIGRVSSTCREWCFLVMFCCGSGALSTLIWRTFASNLPASQPKFGSIPYAKMRTLLRAYWWNFEEYRGNGRDGTVVEDDGSSGGRRRERFKS